MRFYNSISKVRSKYAYHKCIDNYVPGDVIEARYLYIA